jgi:hypothetical protein
MVVIWLLFSLLIQLIKCRWVLGQTLQVGGAITWHILWYWTVCKSQLLIICENLNLMA